MTGERELHERLRRIAAHPAALGLMDDTAVFEGLVITHDSIAEGIHFLPADPPASVGWKLVAVNLSDLAAKGAEPQVALLSFSLSGDALWDGGFLDGVEAACESYGLELIGGDTFSLPAGAPRVFGMTAIGRAGANVPLRSGGKAGDALWVAGSIGDSAAGLEQLFAAPSATGALVDIYRRPVPLIAAGQALASRAHAMMDVSDGLLLDGSRLAEASRLSARIELDRLPLSQAYREQRGDGLDSLLFAATGGDDYALLCALPDGLDPATLSLPSGTRMARIGSLERSGPPLQLTHGGQAVAVPERLGHEHFGNSAAPASDRF